jgi:acyl carrier protein
VATSLEALVHETWVEILQIPAETIGLGQSFRSLGGSSLQAAEIHATLEDKLGGLISHEMLTESDTVAAMADYISREHPELLEGLSKK